MKYVKPLLIGMWNAIKVFISFVVFIVPLNFAFDYFEGKDTSVYFTLGFVFNFFTHPLVIGVLTILSLLSCINQFRLVKNAT